MKIIIAGSTGMIGSIILEHCIQSSEVTEIINLLRRSVDPPSSSKVQNIVIKDFNTYDNRHDLFKDCHAGLFCIGAYTGQVPDDIFKMITVDYAVNFAKILRDNNNDTRICLLSGAGADRTEKSRTSFARYKGMAENQISELGLNFHTFRPAYIYPVTPRKEPNLIYKISRSLYPVIKLLGKNSSIKSTELALAMYSVALNGAEKEILENADIINQINSIK